MFADSFLVLLFASTFAFLDVSERMIYLFDILNGGKQLALPMSVFEHGPIKKCIVDLVFTLYFYSLAGLA